MPASKLRAWYESMLARAMELGAVSSFGTLQDHVKSLESVRDFPLFDGDFFADALPDVLHKPTERVTEPTIGRQTSQAVAKQVQTEVKKQRAHFLVATLNAADTSKKPVAAGVAASSTSAAADAGASTAAAEDKDADALHCESCAEPPLSNELVDARSSLLGAMRDRHWQWNELRRAHYSSLMMLAYLGRPPPP